ncbi:hypothetical protein Bhyg_10598 [Pseudolycoriella hygida]|uniref:Uncharacterized protein n=1 Tax=Pseudolycoriella hygida TaxID=35572 RepID=A0A9Q0MTS5_9DIPT|nr:hypothetical protein Bhyg_10598 [Pseudolycoriella hygida]
MLEERKKKTFNNKEKGEVTGCVRHTANFPLHTHVKSNNLRNYDMHASLRIADCGKRKGISLRVERGVEGEEGLGKVLERGLTNDW